jgi:hypothetical protein
LVILTEKFTVQNFCTFPEILYKSKFFGQRENLYIVCCLLAWGEGMHAVRNWDEEVVKWLAVGMCLAMVGMAVMPAVGVGNIAGVVTGVHAGYHASSSGEAIVDGAYEGLLASTVPLAAYGILVGAGIATGGAALVAGLAIAA